MNPDLIFHLGEVRMPWPTEDSIPVAGFFDPFNSLAPLGLKVNPRSGAIEGIITAAPGIYTVQVVEARPFHIYAAPPIDGNP
jgi:hypothetical protein